MQRNEFKTKSENKNKTNECRCFLESNYVGVNRLFALVYSNNKNALKRQSAFSYYLPKGTINNYNFIIDEKKKKNYDQPIDSDIKQCKEVRKLRTC